MNNVRLDSMVNQLKFLQTTYNNHSCDDSRLFKWLQENINQGLDLSIFHEALEEFEEDRNWLNEPLNSAIRKIETILSYVSSIK